MPDTALSLDGVRVPRFLDGTAWKEGETQRRTQFALRLGFRIDTANQRRHYPETVVGLEVFDFRLGPEEVERIEGLALA